MMTTTMMMIEQGGATTQRRKRKHGWGAAQGVVVAVRLPENVNATLESQAALKGLPKGVYAKQLLERAILDRQQPQGIGWLGTFR